MLLAIGFIMISGALLVGTVQTQTTIQNITGDAIAKGAVRIFEGGAHYNVAGATMAKDGQVHFDATAATQYIQGERINSTDNRYGWVPFYRWDAPTSMFQVYIIATQCRNASSYPYLIPLSCLSNDLTPELIITATLNAGGGGAPDTITGLTSADRAATGAYVIIQNNPSNAACNGMILQLGAPLAGGGFELVPGRDLQSKSPVPTGSVSLYVVGMGLADPTQAPSATNGFTGKAQDIAVYPLPSSGNAGASVPALPQ